jgi:hypothetical protein
MEGPIFHQALMPLKANTRFFATATAVQSLVRIGLLALTSSIGVENFLVKSFNRRLIAGRLIQFTEIVTGR